jgi:hypothetical protein
MRIPLLFFLVLSLILSSCASDPDTEGYSYLLQDGTNQGSFTVMITDSVQYEWLRWPNFEEKRILFDDSMQVYRFWGDSCANVHLNNELKFAYTFDRWRFQENHVLDENEQFIHRTFSFAPLLDSVRVKSNKYTVNTLSYFSGVESLPVEMHWFWVDGRQEHWELDSSYVFSPQWLNQFMAHLGGCESVPIEPFIIHPKHGTPLRKDILFKLAVKDEEGENLEAKVKVSRFGSAYYSSLLPAADASFHLPLEGIFTVEVSAEGYFPKRVEFDFTDFDHSLEYGSFETQMDFILLNREENIPDSLFAVPIGKGRYNPEVQSIEFDLEYTRERQQLIQQALEEGIKDSSTP